MDKNFAKEDKNVNDFFSSNDHKVAKMRFRQKVRKFRFDNKWNSVPVWVRKVILYWWQSLLKDAVIK